MSAAAPDAPVPDRPLVEARRLVGRQLGAYAAVLVLMVVVGVIGARDQLEDRLGVGLISPLLIAAALIAITNPKRRLAGPPQERPADAALATEEDLRKVDGVLLAVLLGLAALVAVIVGDYVLIAAVCLGHVIALAVLRARLGRLERRLDSPLLQPISAGGWRDPLYPWREPGSVDPAVAAALGQRAHGQR